MLDRISEWMANHKGAPVLVGVALVVVNLLLRPLSGVPIIGVVARSDIFLHLGVIVGLLGILIGDAL